MTRLFNKKNHGKITKAHLIAIWYIKIVEFWWFCHSVCSFLFKWWVVIIGLYITVYPKKYAHDFCFAVLCCGYTLTEFPISIRLTSLALWQSNDCPSASKATLMNMDKYFMWIHYERLHNHNKAKHNKTVCIFLGIYCIYYIGAEQATRNYLNRRSSATHICGTRIDDRRFHEVSSAISLKSSGQHKCTQPLIIIEMTNGMLHNSLQTSVRSSTISHRVERDIHGSKSWLRTITLRWMPTSLDEKMFITDAYVMYYDSLLVRTIVIWQYNLCSTRNA